MEEHVCGTMLRPEAVTGPAELRALLHAIGQCSAHAKPRADQFKRKERHLVSRMSPKRLSLALRLFSQLKRVHPTLAAGFDFAGHVLSPARGCKRARIGKMLNVVRETHATHQGTEALRQFAASMKSCKTYEAVRQLRTFVAGVAVAAPAATTGAPSSPILNQIRDAFCGRVCRFQLCSPPNVSNATAPA